MKKQQGVQGVEIGLRLAFALAHSPGPMALKELARAAKLPPSKTHRYLVSLCRAGIVRQDGPNGRYDLGTGALELGLAAQRRLDEFRLADQAIAELWEETGLTVGLVVWGDNGPTVVRRKEGAHPVTVSTRVGSNLVLPRLRCTAYSSVTARRCTITVSIAGSTSTYWPKLPLIMNAPAQSGVVRVTGTHHR